jgi:thioredoxin-like negative regulator of GroEL
LPLSKADDESLKEQIVEEEPLDQKEPVDHEDELAELSAELSGYSPDELMEKAKDAYKEGRMEEALTFFKELLKKDPDSSKARFMIRRISTKLGQ